MLLTLARQHHIIWLSFALIAILTLVRVAFLYSNGLDLFFDEAQYWIWSNTPDWGYYSKPPMVAWIIALTGNVCGDTEACIRVSSPLLHLLTSGIVYLIGTRLYSSNVGLLSALLYASLPAVSLSSMLVSTDASLLLFWACSLYLLIKAVDTDRWDIWALAGVAAGLGMLSKYNMILFLASTMIYFGMVERQSRVLFSVKFWTACIIAGFIFLPNIWWNAQHGFVSFLHTKDNANLGGDLIHIDKFFEFVGAQFGVFGPISFGILLWILFSYKRFVVNRSHHVLVWYILPMLGLILVIALLSRAHANWAAPIYVPASILVCAVMVEIKKQRLIYISIILHIVLMILMMNLNTAARLAGYTLTSDAASLSDKTIKDPMARLRGWSDLGEHIRVIKSGFMEEIIVTDSRQIFTELKYYAPEMSEHMVKWNPNGVIQDHFELTTRMDDVAHSPIMFVTHWQRSEHLAQYFDRCVLHQYFEIEQQRPKDRTYYVFLCDGFKGYK